MEELSKTVFGQLNRLRVMVYIAESSGPVNPTDMVGDLGLLALSAVQLPLRDLTAAGLLKRLPGTSGRTQYQRVESLVWPWVLQLRDQCTSSDDSAAQVARSAQEFGGPR